MPVTYDVQEKNLGRKYSSKSGERQYVIRVSGGEASEDEVVAAMLADGGVPGSIGGNVRQDADASAEELAPGLFVGTVPFANPDWQGNKVESSFRLSFDVSSTTQKITQSRQTVHSYHDSIASFGRDFKGAIGVNSDGSVEGCDIIVPATSYKIDYTFPANQFDDGTYIRKLIAAVGSVNNAAFKGTEEGESLLTSVSGQKRADGKWDLTFVFSISLNETGLSIGDIGVSIEKQGWDYLWAYYEPRKLMAGDVPYVAKVPTNVYVERVYRRTNYADLGLT